MTDHIREELKFNSEKRLNMLKMRSKRCVCKFCGGTLRVKQIIFTNYEDSRIEIFCDNCNRIEFGVEPAIYNNAKYYVEELGFTCYPDLENNEKTKQMTVARVAEIMEWEDKNIGILTMNGFTVPIVENNHLVGECVTLTDADLR